MNVIECKVLLYNEKEENLLGESKEIWSRCIVDLDDVSAIRECEDEKAFGNAVVHFKHGDYFIIDQSYEYMAKNWIRK